jgi:RNA polymerase sigma factor (sigma-70 family)
VSLEPAFFCPGEEAREGFIPGETSACWKKLCHVFPFAAGTISKRVNQDSRQIESLVELHRPFVLRVAARLAPLPSLAEDIAQQVFLEFLSKIEQWDLSGDLKPLLATMTRNVALRHWRERSVHLSAELRGLVEHIRDLAAASEPTPFHDDETDILRKCLAKLPPRSRRLLEWRYGTPLRCSEIAAQLALKPEAVRQALTRLRDQLRRCMAEAMR